MTDSALREDSGWEAQYLSPFFSKRDGNSFHALQDLGETSPFFEVSKRGHEGIECGTKQIV